MKKGAMLALFSALTLAGGVMEAPRAEEVPNVEKYRHSLSEILKYEGSFFLGTRRLGMEKQIQRNNPMGVCTAIHFAKEAFNMPEELNVGVVNIYLSDFANPAHLEKVAKDFGCAELSQTPEYQKEVKDRIYKNALDHFEKAQSNLDEYGGEAVCGRLTIVDRHLALLGMPYSSVEKADNQGRRFLNDGGDTHGEWEAHQCGQFGYTLRAPK